MTGRLILTDGTTIVNLFNQATKGAGFFIQDWLPQASPLKDGGVWNSSPFSQGRQLVAYEWANTIDTFTLGVNGACQDDVIRDTQKLRRLLIKALDYWAADHQHEPVWLEARGDSETHTRYATIMGFEAPGDANPFATPFASLDMATIEAFTLVLEHDVWGHQKPGTGACVPLSGEFTAQTSEIAAPEGNTDDVYAIETSSSLITGLGLLFFGKGGSGEPLDTGIRFRNVDIPQGATILSAFVKMIAPANSPATPCHALIYAEDADNPAAFSTYANFAARTRTSAHVAWNNVPTFVTGQAYDTPDLTAVIQEVVDRGGFASGNSLVIFLEDNNSASATSRALAAYENPVYQEAKLYVTYQLAQTLGQEATCAAEVYVANKRNEANLTHLFHYTSKTTTYSGNLMNSAPPFALFPNPPDVGDILYLGSEDTTFPLAPFCSGVFDLSVIQEDVSTVAYEYWNGATWAALTPQDNTAGTGTIPFSVLGVASMHWEQPYNWATTTVNGISGFFIRIRITAVGASPVAPVQQNRLPYSITWPYAEIAADEIKGDLPARAKVEIVNQADGTNDSSVLTLNVDWILLATRSVSRGDAFTPFLNLADTQNPSGITVDVGTSSAFVDDLPAPAGRSVRYNPAGVDSYAARAVVTLENAIFRDYAGTFRAFVRVKQIGGSASDMNVRLRVASNNENYVFFTSDPVPVTLLTASTSNQYQLLDFGAVTLPDKNFSSYLLLVDADNREASTPGDLYLADLILMPVDECAIEASEALESIEGMLGYFDGNRKLVLDSVSDPRQLLDAELRKVADDTVISFYVAIPEHLLQLQQGAKQRVYFLSWNRLTSLSFVTTAYSLQMSRVHQYLTAIGAE